MPRPKPPGPDIARPKGNDYSLTKLFNSLQSLDQVLNFTVFQKHNFLEMNMSDLTRIFLLQRYLTKIPDYVCATFLNGEIHINTIIYLL